MLNLVSEFYTDDFVAAMSRTLLNEEILAELKSVMSEPNFHEEQKEEQITIQKIKEGYYRVEGPGIERLLGYTNMADERGFAFFQRFLRNKGIIDRLEEMGIQENDTVQLYELEFDYWK